MAIEGGARGLDQKGVAQGFAQHGSDRIRGGNGAIRQQDHRRGLWQIVVGHPVVAQDEGRWHGAAQVRDTTAGNHAGPQMGERGANSGAAVGAGIKQPDHRRILVGLRQRRGAQAPPACLLRDERQGDVEPRASALARQQRQGAPHQRHQLAADREAQTGAAKAAGRGVVHLLEGGKDLVLLIRRDAHPAVMNRDHDLVGASGAGAQGDMPLQREFHGIARDIHEDLA